MADIQKGSTWLIPEKFGPLWKYISDDNIVNIDWDAGALWIQKANRIRERIFDPEITDKFMMDLSIRVGNESGENFNATDKYVMAETDTLRIVCLHPTFSLSGVTVAIRKSLPKLRFNTKMAIEQGYCDEQVLYLLINCVLAHKNFVFCGEPGKGKTESAKFFSSFIPANNKVITVEDILEWHYKEINPGKSCIEIKVRSHQEYEDALALAVRLNPAWIMLAETRGREVRYLLESWTNGVSNMTTLHTNHVRNIPERIINMLGIENNQQNIVDQIYNNVGVGIQLEEIEIGNGDTKHIISEVGFFYRKDAKNYLALVVEEGIFYPERMPAYVINELTKKLGHDPYECFVAYDNTAPLVAAAAKEDASEDLLNIEETKMTEVHNEEMNENKETDKETAEEV